MIDVADRKTRGFKFQYDNTLRKGKGARNGNLRGFKFQYDNTLRGTTKSNLNIMIDI